MKERLEAIREQAIAKIKDAKDISVLNDVRVEILGKKDWPLNRRDSEACFH